MLAGDAGEAIAAEAFQERSQFRVGRDAREERGPDRMRRPRRRYSAGGDLGDVVRWTGRSAYAGLQIESCPFCIAEPVVSVPLLDCCRLAPIRLRHALDGCDRAGTVDMCRRFAVSVFVRVIPTALAREIEGEACCFAIPARPVPLLPLPFGGDVAQVV